MKNDEKDSCPRVLRTGAFADFGDFKLRRGGVIHDFKLGGGGDARENFQKSGLTSADEAEDFTFADFDSYIAHRLNFFLGRAPKDLKGERTKCSRVSELRTASQGAALLFAEAFAVNDGGHTFRN
jgi:hypothetical protein